MCTFVVTVPVVCRLRAPGPDKFIREGSSGSRKFCSIDTKVGALMEFNECNSMVVPLRASDLSPFWRL